MTWVQVFLLLRSSTHTQTHKQTDRQTDRKTWLTIIPVLASSGGFDSRHGGSGVGLVRFAGHRSGPQQPAMLWGFCKRRQFTLERCDVFLFWRLRTWTCTPQPSILRRQKRLNSWPLNWRRWELPGMGGMTLLDELCGSYPYEKWPIFIKGFLKKATSLSINSGPYGQ